METANNTSKKIADCFNAAIIAKENLIITAVVVNHASPTKFRTVLYANANEKELMPDKNILYKGCETLEFEQFHKTIADILAHYVNDEKKVKHLPELEFNTAHEWYSVVLYYAVEKLLRKWSELEYQLVPGIGMIQVIFPIMKEKQIRINIIYGTGGGCIHNHRKDFVSIGMYGRYIEWQWGIDEDKAGHHYETKTEGKNENFTEAVKKTGNLIKKVRRVQYPTSILKTNNNLFHTIHPFSDDDPFFCPFPLGSHDNQFL